MKIVIPKGRMEEFLSGEGMEGNLQWYMSRLESFKKPLWCGMKRYMKINDDLEKKISQLHYDTAFFLRQIHRKRRDVTCLSQIKCIINDQIDDLLTTKPKRKVRKRKGRKIRNGRRHYWWYFE